MFSARWIRRGNVVRVEVVLGKIAHVLESDHLWSDSVPDILVNFSFAFPLLIGLGYRISIGEKGQ